MINAVLLTHIISVIFLAITFAATTIIPVISSILILLSKNHPVKKAIGFLIGFYVGVIIIFVSVYLIIQFFTFDFIHLENTLSNSLFNLIAGLILILISVKFFKDRKSNSIQTKVNHLFESINDLSAFKCSLISFTLIITTPKNWILIYITLVFLLKIYFGVFTDLLILIIYLVLTSVAVLIPIIISILIGKKIQPTLNKIKNWLIINSNNMIGLFLLIAGILMIYTALSGNIPWNN